MSKYTVDLGAFAYAKTTLQVEAVDEDEAVMNALEAQAEGDCEWKYQGVKSDSIVVNGVMKA